jgi:RNA polymerase sigma-70 factor (ECF subfamily)
MLRHACGDEAAFTIVFDAVAPPIARFARRVLGDQAAAEDIVQLTLLKMTGARENFAAGSKVLPWAYAIARNQIRDQLRRKRRERRFLQRAERAITPTGTSAPDAQLLADETLAAFRAELADMPEAQRAAYLLMRREDLSLAEAAGRLGTTTTAVKLRVHRAVTRFRAGLDDGSPCERRRRRAG